MKKKKRVKNNKEETFYDALLMLNYGFKAFEQFIKEHEFLLTYKNETLKRTILHEIVTSENIPPKFLHTFLLKFKNRIKINEVDFHGKTPLHLACIMPTRMEYSEHRIEVIKILINHGADIFLKDVYGCLALETFFRHTDEDTYEMLLGWLAEHHPDKSLEVSSMSPFSLDF